MRILVCINKPDDELDAPAGSSAQSEDLTILDTDNENALEAALRIKDALEYTAITALTVGPAETENMLRECIAKGADEGVLVTGDPIDYDDPWMVAEAMTLAIKKLGDFDLILAGNSSMDLDIIQITPQLSEKLDIPLISQVSELTAHDGSIEVKSEMEHITLDLKASLPCILSVIKEINTPRYTTIQNMIMSLSADLTTWGAGDLGLDGIEGMPVETLLSFPLKPRGEGMVIEGDSPEEIAEKLMNNLRKKAVL